MSLILRTTVGIALMLLAATPAWAQTLRVTAATTNLRTQASADASIVIALKQGAELEMISRDGQWYKVRVTGSGQEGFIHSLMVETVSASSQPPAAASSTAPAGTPTPSVPQVSTTAPKPAVPSAGQPIASSAAGINDRRYLIRLHGGVFSGYVNSGLGFGGGVAGKPFDNDKLEIEGDFSYASLGTYVITDRGYKIDPSPIKLYQGSVNVLYDFQLANPKFTPFAGAGLAYSDTRLRTTVEVPTGFFEYVEKEYSASFGGGLHLQLMGGIQWPLNDRRAFRVEIRTGFPGVALLAGMSF